MKKTYLPTQDPKYSIMVETDPGVTVRKARLVNASTLEPIPTDEPVMLFRAKDRQAGRAIAAYLPYCLEPLHYRAVDLRRLQFVKFAIDHPDRMKDPDTTADVVDDVAELVGDFEERAGTA